MNRSVVVAAARCTISTQGAAQWVAGFHSTLPSSRYSYRSTRAGGDQVVGAGDAVEAELLAECGQLDPRIYSVIAREREALAGWGCSRDIYSGRVRGTGGGPKPVSLVNVLYGPYHRARCDGTQ